MDEQMAQAIEARLKARAGERGQVGALLATARQQVEDLVRRQGYVDGVLDGLSEALMALKAAAADNETEKNQQGTGEANGATDGQTTEQPAGE